MTLRKSFEIEARVAVSRYANLDLQEPEPNRLLATERSHQ
jgi:hypothetical protein